MPQTWQERDMERRELLKGFKEALWRLEEEHGRREANLRVARNIIRLFEAKVANGESKVLARRMPIDSIREDPAWFFIYSDVLPAIDAFSRTNEEAESLLAQFLEYVIRSLTDPFHQELRKVEAHQPEKIYG